jgi:ABC-2 type transport system permease protein
VISLLKAEFLKLRSTRTSLGLGIAVLLVTAATTVLLIAFVSPRLLNGGELSAGATLVTYIVLVFGILGMTNEYRHGTITYTYLATPRRARVMVAKLVVYGATGALAMLVALLIGQLIGVVGLPVRGVSYQMPDGAMLADYARQIGVAGLVTCFGVALGAFLRAQVVTVAGALIWALLVEPLIVAFKPGVGTWLPFNVFGQVTSSSIAADAGNAAATTGLSRPEAFLVSVVYIAVVSVAAVVVSMSRDVT